jgi:replicative superfamily II helicase
MANSTESTPQIEQAYQAAMRRRVLASLQLPFESIVVDRYVALVSELLAWDSLHSKERLKAGNRKLAGEAFYLVREAGSFPDTQQHLGWPLRVACLAVLADRPQEASKALREIPLVTTTSAEEDWLGFVRESVQLAWTGLLRESNRDDVLFAQSASARLKQLQKPNEKKYLDRVREGALTTPVVSDESEDGQRAINRDALAKSERRMAAAELLAYYFLAVAAERLSEFLVQGRTSAGGDISEQLDMFFERAATAVDHVGGDLEGLDLLLLLKPTAHQLSENSLREATRTANDLTRKFTDSLLNGPKPFFQLLPPQRVAIEQGLIGAGQRAVVVNFPTSSGKTLLAEFRILQALSDVQNSWVAYVAPTRALVNQVTSRLRRDFASLDKRVERLSPALEFDSVELAALHPRDAARDGPPVNVLVCTPEKLDLLMRRDDVKSALGELSLVVVDEAHGLGGSSPRAIKLELMLSMLNREHPSARFLLLTPFISNAKQVADWLDHRSSRNYSIEAEWVPNDRIIGIATAPSQTEVGRGVKASFVRFAPTITPKRTLQINETLELHCKSGDLAYTAAQLKQIGKVATATAQVLSSRGPTVLMCKAIRDTWTAAEHLARFSPPPSSGLEERQAVAQFVRDELGDANQLSSFILKGIAVHHAGLPEEVSQAIEYLFERGHLSTLCATTTLAQGVNFPIANLVLGSLHQGRHGSFISYSDFWNIAGRVGRVDQDSVGVVALAANDDASAEKCRVFLRRSGEHLVSMLVGMVEDLRNLAADKGLASLTYKTEWSAFGQFIAHTLRQVGSVRFPDQVELVLRGTLGYQTLREENAPLASALLTETRKYAAELATNMGLVSLVDSTGFSFESVKAALVKLSEVSDVEDVLNPEILFSGNSKGLENIMGVLLTIPEVKEGLVDGGGGHGGGDRIARMLADWVSGKSLEDLAKQYFDGSKPASALSDCVKAFKKLAMTSAWGLSSILSMRFGAELKELSDEQRGIVTNIPSMVLYGVSTVQQIALRAAGVPRNASASLAKHLRPDTTPFQLRAEVQNRGQELWVKAMGQTRGEAYHRVWSMLEG